jgi:nicotinate-nucleotide adenylyltransferase
VTDRPAPGARIGLLGGTFDPPHMGHLVMASEARWQLGLDRVLLVPARQPPHKPAGPDLPGKDRARLIELAIADDPWLELSRLELERPGPSYTVETLAAVRRAEPDAALWFVLGADQLLGLPTWREPERIAELARLAVVPRGGHGREELEAAAEEIAPGRVDWVLAPEIGISSSQVRRRIATGRPIRYLVPGPVEDELRRMGLVPSP